jgi:hypothetical protein
MIPAPKPHKHQEERFYMRLRVAVLLGFIAFIVVFLIGVSGVIQSMRDTMTRPNPPTDLRAE